MKDALVNAQTMAARTVRTVLSPTGVRGTAREVAWLAAHVVTYPFGVVAERRRDQHEQRYSLAGLPPVQRGLLNGDVEAAGTPILLVHGLVDNRSIFTVLRRGLRRRGFGRVVAMNYPVFTGDVRSAAERLAGQVEQLCAETGYERVHVVGHSLGGIIARYYVQRLGGDERVHTLVTLGSPHRGTHTARLLPQRIVQQLRPGSELMHELARSATGCRTRFIAFWSDLDQLILPKHHAALDHPDLWSRSVFVRGVAHLSLPIDRTVVHEICRALAHLDHDGSTLTRGVTSISPPHRHSGPAPTRRRDASA